MNEKYNCFKEAVCVEVQRVFDSCTDRDCISDLPVTLSHCTPEITDDLTIVRGKCVEIEDVCLSVNSLPFKEGYYSVDITFKFKIVAEAYNQIQACANKGCGTTLCGSAIWSKKAILYGSEGTSKVYASTDTKLPESFTECGCNKQEYCEKACTCGNGNPTAPKATLNVVDPILRDAQFVCVPPNAPDPGVCGDQYIPCGCGCGCNSCNTCNTCNTGCNTGCGSNNGCGCTPKPYKRMLYVTLGLFSIISLSRPVSIIVPAYDYCIPCKDCSPSAVGMAESPCEVFGGLQFPVSAFFPQPEKDAASPFNCGCDCSCQ
jgi:hypothetical protein